MVSLRFQLRLDGKEVVNPATEEVIAKTPFSTTEEVNEVIQKAKTAFQSWSKTPVVDRIQPLFKLKTLLEEHSEKISTIITEEHGKTLVESRGDLRRAIQMVEMAVSAPVMLQGKSSKDVAKKLIVFLIVVRWVFLRELIPLTFRRWFLFGSGRLRWRVEIVLW